MLVPATLRQACLAGLLLIFGLMPAMAVAQHSDVDFRYTGAQVVPDLSPDSNFVYRGTFPTSGFGAQFTIQPGFASESDIGAGIGGGDEIVYNVLDDLYFWDGITMDFQTPAAGTQIRIGNVGTSVPDTIVHATSGVQLGSFSPDTNRIGAAGGTGEFHSHVDFTLEPPGGSPADGVYGLKVSLSTDAAGIADSDPFFLAFNFGLSAALFDQAVLDYEAALNPCTIGDVNCDGYVEIGADILTAFTNFTGPGSFGKTRSQGDVHGPSAATTDPDGHDGDVDVSDILTIFGAFTGPPPDEAGGLGGPAEAGDPSIPDLVYDSATGEVTLDPDGSSIIGYSLQNATNSFLPGNHTPILAGVTTALTSQLEEAALAPGSGSIGQVFPTGLDLAGLQSLLTVNQVSRSLGAPLVPFDLVVLNAGPVVPEPSTWALGALALAGLVAGKLRRRRAKRFRK